MRKRNLHWIGLATVGALGVAAWLAASSGLLGKTHEAEPAAGSAVSPKPATQGVAVTVASVTPRAVQRQVEIVGTLWGHDEMELAPKVGGRVVRIARDLGDVVHPGDVLLEIDDTDYKLAVAEAQRSLELEFSRLGLTAAPPANFDVRTLPSVHRAQLLEKNAREDLARLKSLAPRNAVARQELEQAETNFLVAEANTRQAVIDAEQTLASIRYKQAMLETAQQRLRDTRLAVPEPSTAPGAPAVAPASSGPAETAPARYVVAGRMVSEGEMVHAAPPSTVFRLVMDRPLKLKATVPERYVGEVRVGQQVELGVEAYPGEKFHGTVSRINPTIDRANRTFQIEVLVPNESGRLHAGSFAKAAILTRQDPAAPTVPEESLVRFAGVVKVFVVENDRARAVPVEPRVRLAVQGPDDLENWVEVAGDLQLGAPVVTSGQSQLAEGTAVRIRSGK